MKKIKQYINMRDITLTQFAKELGISKSYLSLIKDDKRTPRLPLLKKFSEITNGFIHPFDFTIDE